MTAPTERSGRSPEPAPLAIWLYGRLWALFLGVSFRARVAPGLVSTKGPTPLGPGGR